MEPLGLTAGRFASGGGHIAAPGAQQVMSLSALAKAADIKLSVVDYDHGDAKGWLESIIHVTATLHVEHILLEAYEIHPLQYNTTRLTTPSMPIDVEAFLADTSAVTPGVRVKKEVIEDSPVRRSGDRYDPATGKPLPDSPAVSEELQLSPSTLRSGTRRGLETPAKSAEKETKTAEDSSSSSADATAPAQPSDEQLATEELASLQMKEMKEQINQLQRMLLR